MKCEFSKPETHINIGQKAIGRYIKIGLERGLITPKQAKKLKKDNRKGRIDYIIINRLPFGAVEMKVRYFNLIFKND